MWDAHYGVALMRKAHVLSPGCRCVHVGQHGAEGQQLGNPVSTASSQPAHTVRQSGDIPHPSQLRATKLVLSMCPGEGWLGSAFSGHPAGTCTQGRKTIQHPPDCRSSLSASARLPTFGPLFLHDHLPLLMPWILQLLRAAGACP